MEDTMSFFCPWQDAQFEKCRRTGDTACLPGKPGCVLFGKVSFVKDSEGWTTGEGTDSTPARAKRVRTRGSSARMDSLVAGSSRVELLDRLEVFPALLRLDLAAIPSETMVGRWTVAQVVHHLADVHAAGLARVRRALTEVEPKVEPYDHEAWARLADAGNRDLLEASLNILEGTHTRWSALLRSLNEDGWVRAYRQSQPRRRVSVDADLRWHVEHGEVHRSALRESAWPQGAS